jgi:uncharacterized protein YuzE
MKITHDLEADAMLIYLDEEAQFHQDRRINERVILNLDLQGNVVGIELLHVSKYVKQPQQIDYVDITRQNATGDVPR